MSFFSTSLNKIKTRLSGVAARMPAKGALSKGAKAAALLGAIALAGKLGQSLIRKKVDKSVNEGKNNALSEVKTAVNKNIEKFILECVLRWLTYLFLIALAYLVAVSLNLRKDVLIAFVILGIYSFYVVKAARVFRWYISFLRENGVIFNPIKIIRAYLRRAILDRIQRSRAGLPLHEKLAMDFFGPASDKIADDIASSSMESIELRREAFARMGMWIGGWIVYALVYEKLFLLVTGIDFKSAWEPIIWPFYALIKILAVQR